MTLVLDPIDVLRRDDTPAHFLWRGRLYAVRAVLAHWLEHGAGAPTDVGWEPLGTSPGPADPTNPTDPADRECWRVRAAAGRSSEPGVFDLCFAPVDGDWRLAPVPPSGSDAAPEHS